MNMKIWALVLVCAIVALLAFGIVALLMNISDRKSEKRETYARLVALDENTVDPALWGENFPRQYEGYLRTVDTERTRFGGSEAFSRLEADQRLLRIFAGYAFGIDFREERGHYYTLLDQQETKRVTERKQPGACVHCHASIIPLYREIGEGDVMRGFEEVCSWPIEDVHARVEHPVACIDCHDPDTMKLRVTRPAFLNAIKELKRLDGIEDYDPNVDATRQQMRTYVCGQCHVEYYFKGERKTLTYPWAQGLKVEQIEAYYDEHGFSDWTHAETGAAVLKAQHPEFEMWNQGIHARSGVACADCHMPYIREGAIKISDHHVRSPLLNVERACLTCHSFPAEEMIARAELIQERNRELMLRAEDAILALYDEVVAARAAGATDEQLAEALQLQRRAQFRSDFVNAENSNGFHAPQEAARILGEAIDFARQGELAALRAYSNLAK
jgi:nitrite reductase (cytochrome c-552)